MFSSFKRGKVYARKTVKRHGFAKAIAMGLPCTDAFWDGYYAQLESQFFTE